MTVVINGTTGISPVTAAGTSALVDGMTVGRGAGEVATNTAVGASALAANTTGADTTAIGYQAGYSNTTGARNTFVGEAAGYLVTTGVDNTTLGFGALASGGGSGGAANNNVAIGTSTLKANTASNNTAVGYQAGYSNTTGTYQTFVGYTAGHDTTGTNSTFVGQGAGYFVTTGAKNTILGQYNGNQGGLDIRTASNYIVLSDGDGNVRAACASNGAWQVGFGGGDTLRAYNTAAAGSVVSLYVGYNSSTGVGGTLSYNVTTNGNVTNTNNSYGAISDIKLKENITDATPKLEKLCQVRVVNYNFKEGQTQKQLGVIAQELEQVFPAMIEEFPDKDAEGNELGTTSKSVKYSVFVPMLVKAIQELKAEFDAYKEAHP